MCYITRLLWATRTGKGSALHMLPRIPMLLFLVVPMKEDDDSRAQSCLGPQQQLAISMG